jgi:hypothetical protein
MSLRPRQQHWYLQFDTSVQEREGMSDGVFGFGLDTSFDLILLWFDDTTVLR